MAALALAARVCAWRPTTRYPQNEAEAGKNSDSKTRDAPAAAGRARLGDAREPPGDIPRRGGQRNARQGFRQELAKRLAQRKRPLEVGASCGEPLELAEWTGLEPATPGVTGRYSNQLNYHSVVAGGFCLEPGSLRKCCRTWRPLGDSNPCNHRERVVS